MWQEIVVGLLVAVSAVFIIRRFWNSFRSYKTNESSCSCGCTACSVGAVGTDCQTRPESR
jgi:hypothetical protein